jgi:hypothetical protein
MSNSANEILLFVLVGEDFMSGRLMSGGVLYIREVILVVVYKDAQAKRQRFLRQEYEYASWFELERW